MAIGSREEHASVETLARTFRYLFAAQLLLRGITFLFNTWIVRHLDEEDLALYAVKFHVFLTVVMLSREGIRRACMRVDTKSSEGGQFEASIAKLLRIAWCTPVIGLLFVFATCTFCFRSQSLNYSDPFGWAIIIFGLIVIAFGPSYSYALTRILYEKKWSDGEASTALRYYCLYVIFVAMNGTSEAFVHAVADKRELKQSNNSLVMFSVIYMLLNVTLVQYAGAIGLITANSINMILRIIYSAIFIRHYFQGSSSFAFRRCVPSGWPILLLSSIITLLSERFILDRENFWPTFLFHFSIGFACFCVSVIHIYRREKNFVHRIIRYQEHVD